MNDLNIIITIIMCVILCVIMSFKYTYNFIEKLESDYKTLD